MVESNRKDTAMSEATKECKITPNEYQEFAMRFVNRELDETQTMVNAVMGLCGESGEAIDLVKKHIGQGHDLDKVHFAKELGDVAWYLAEAAYSIGYDLETILEMNIEKLSKRYPEGHFSVERSINRPEGDI